VAKNHIQKMKSRAAAAAAASDIEPTLDPEIQSASLANQDEVASLAYAYWQERGCPEGSPEEDWFRAEADLRRQVQAAAAV